MKIKTVYCLSFSPTGHTKMVTDRIARTLAGLLDVPCCEIPWTLPGERDAVQRFSDADLVVVGGPTYAGKLPNKMLPDYQSKLKGNGALAVAVVTFGNRSFDNALAELCATLEADGFHTVAGGAFAGTHAFSDALAAGRPNEADRREMDAFSEQIAGKIQALRDIPEPIRVPGDAGAPYYVPKGVDGQPAKFLKAKPQTDLERCTKCGLCARMCPMGSIDRDDPSQVPGICIKCQRCVRNCPLHAKYFDDPAFLSHVRMLEESFERRAENYLAV